MSGGRLVPKHSVVKQLFALSCNTCFYDGCEHTLTDSSWTGVNCDIAHICGERPGSARFDETMTDEARRAFENLLLLCPYHHRIVDVLDVEGHSVDRLRVMKANHESRCDGKWAGDEALDVAVEWLLDSLQQSHGGGPPESPLSLDIAASAMAEPIAASVSRQGVQFELAAHVWVSIVNRGPGGEFEARVTNVRGLGETQDADGGPVQVAWENVVSSGIHIGRGGGQRVKLAIVTRRPRAFWLCLPASASWSPDSHAHGLVHEGANLSPVVLLDLTIQDIETDATSVVTVEINIGSEHHETSARIV